MLDFSVENYINSLSSQIDNLNLLEVNTAIDLIENKFTSGRKIAVCGSALAAAHYITDWNKMINLKTGKQFRGVSLVDNIGLVTAYANDISYADIFSEQVKNLLSEGDLLIALSGSGNSENIVKAVSLANDLGVSTLAVCGFDGGRIKQIADDCIWIKSCDMQLYEDIQVAIGHMVMKAICGYKIIEQ